MTQTMIFDATFGEASVDNNLFPERTPPPPTNLMKLVHNDDILTITYCQEICNGRV